MESVLQSGPPVTHRREGLRSSPRSPVPTSIPLPRLTGGASRDDQTTSCLHTHCSCHKGTRVGDLTPGISPRGVYLPLSS